MSNNICHLHGYVGKDAELKTTPGGQTFARFPFATSEGWTDPQGNKQSKTEWHSIIAWAQVAERVGKYIKKGMELNIEGKIEYQQRFDPEDKTKRVYPDYCNIKIRDFTFCGKKSDGSHSDVPDPEPTGRDAVAGGTTSNTTTTEDDDIPF